MYAGGDKQEDGSIKPWNEYSPNEWLTKSVFSLKQDALNLVLFHLKGQEQISFYVIQDVVFLSFLYLWIL